MSEMLGNQYFLSRTFDKATGHFEQVLKQDPDNQNVQKKLVICYCETGHVRDALNQFEKIIFNNIELIALTDIVSEDCPCPEIVDRMKWYEQVAENSFDYNLILGMLNLYCNIEDSLIAFSRAIDIKPEDHRIKKIYDKINSYATNEFSGK